MKPPQRRILAWCVSAPRNLSVRTMWHNSKILTLTEGPKNINRGECTKNTINLINVLPLRNFRQVLLSLQLIYSAKYLNYFVYKNAFGIPLPHKYIKIKRTQLTFWRFAVKNPRQVLLFYTLQGSSTT